MYQSITKPPQNKKNKYQIESCSKDKSVIQQLSCKIIIIITFKAKSVSRTGEKDICRPNLCEPLQLYWEGLFGGHVFIPKTVEYYIPPRKEARFYTSHLGAREGADTFLLGLCFALCELHHSIISGTCNLPATSHSLFSSLFPPKNGRRSALCQQK
jgi:hypothetical protein